MKNRAAPLRVKTVAKRAVKNEHRTVYLVSAVVLSALLLLLVSNARAAGTSVHLETPIIDQGSKKSLQRGAKAFVNHCMGCHSMGYQRYSRMAEDLGLSKEDVEANLIFTTDAEGEPTKFGALMTSSMSAEYGKQAFGVAPPNLALTARSRGVDWIYTYLKSYYLDPSKTTTGVNNLVYPGTAMPHVLGDLQGWQVPVQEEGSVVIDSLKLETPGSLSPEEYDTMAADITNFMAYASDPIKATRHRVGMWVMLFLFVLLGLTYALKKEYWKDVV